MSINSIVKIKKILILLWNWRKKQKSEYKMFVSGKGGWFQNAYE